MATGTGTLTVANLGPALNVGDRFVLFSKPVVNGNAIIVTGGVNWINNLAVDGSITVTSLIAPPVITQQPASITVTQGQAASFSVTASSTVPLGYQWIFCSQLNCTNLPGATSSTLTLNNVQPANAGSYLVVITNAYGSITSSPALLTVVPILSYMVSLPFGFYSLLVNQLDHGSNTANILFPNPSGLRDFDELDYDFDCANGGYTSIYFDSSMPTGFSDLNGSPVPPPVLSPGKGFFYGNGNFSYTSVTFTGTPHVPILPPTLSCGYDVNYLLGRQTNGFGNYSNIVGQSEQEGAKVMTWDAANFSFATNTFTAGAWTLGAPSLTVGQAAMFFIPKPAITLTKFIPAGLSLIANQLDHGSNTLNEVLANVPDGSIIYKYNNINGTWVSATYCAPLKTWTPGSLKLSPGEGAFIQSPTNFNLTLSGTPHTPVLPVVIPAGQTYLLSRQTNGIGNYTNIVGFPPTNGAVVYQWTGSNYNASTFVSGSWTPSEPTVAIGEAVWIAPAGSGGATSSKVTCANNKTVVCGTDWSFDPPTVVSSCSNFNATVTPLSTVTNGAGCSPVITRTWLVTDQCGTSNVCSQTVSFINTNPPILICAHNKTVQCASSWNFNLPLAFDACGGTNAVVTVVTNVTVGSGCSAVSTRTWLATDCFGMTATCSQSVRLTSATPPLITQQPQSRVLTNGNDASFNVIVTGTAPLEYDWFYNGVLVSSSSSNQLALPSVQVADVGNYWVVVQNAGGAVTSRVAALSLVPSVPPSELALGITNQQGSLFVNVADNGTTGYPWQLQSTTNLLNPVWVVETNGAGDTQFTVTPLAKSKFFRAARLQPPSQAAQIQAAYGGLPREQFNTGLLMAPDVSWNPTVLIADGTTLGLNTPIPAGRLLSGSDFMRAYDTLRADYLPGGPLLPDLREIKVSINPAAEPVALEHNLAFQHIYALALAIVPYNTIGTNAFDDGRLLLVDSNNIPFNLLDTNLQVNANQVFVAAGNNSASYVTTNTFAGAGLFRKVLQYGTEPIQFMLPKEYLVAPGMIVDSLQIRFPGVPLVSTVGASTVTDAGFVHISPDQPFSWDFSCVSLDANGDATISLDVRAVIAGRTYDSPGQFTLHRMAPPSANYCFYINYTNYYYPPDQPPWWPSSDVVGSWDNKPKDPKTFFTGVKPGWWIYPWPCLYTNVEWDAYAYSTDADGNVSLVYDGDNPRVDHFDEQFGIYIFRADRQAWGAYWNSDTGQVNSGPQGGNNWACGYNMRLYPATYKKYSANRCAYANNLVLVVDGIDTHSGGVPRTEEDLWDDFGKVGQQLLDKGYDLLVLNYVSGDNYIQRNAYALLEVLTNYVPNFYMAPGQQNDRVAIVSASMGTQVTRYALVAAEQKHGKDHHTGLAIYLDGPFLGANIPWASQGLLQFLANNSVNPSPDAKLILDEVLLSPAARQILRASINYAPDREYGRFYDEMSQFTNAGLPYRARNVAVSCGSGTGLSQVNTHGTFPQTSLAHVATGQQVLVGQSVDSGFGFTIPVWGEVDADVWVEGPTQVSPQQTVLQVLLQAAHYTYVTHSFTHIHFESDSATWQIQKGARPTDLSPGGYTDLPKSIVDQYNTNAGALKGMTGFGYTTFIPVFSGLYVRSAESGVEQLKATQDKSGTTGYGTTSLIGWQQPVYRKHVDFWYGPETSGQIDPTMPAKSPFDAIWYQHSTNIDHVFKLKDVPPPGYEAFVFNELDQFTANEPLTTESVFQNQPKMPLHEEYLIGDLLVDGAHPAELLTINTFTHHAMVQSFAGGNWQMLWNDSGHAGWIGGWAVNKGDKFFLARLTGGKKLLVSFSATSPARAMVQELVNNSGVYFWNVLWNNGGNGKIGPFSIRPTDLYAFGQIGNSSTADRLLVTYPYVCADGLERTVPRTSGLSKASVLTFTGTDWSEVWNNNSTIEMLGTSGIRFGDRLMFGNIGSGLNGDSLFSLNLLRNVFGGPTTVQDFVAGAWSQVWTDGGQSNVGGCGCVGNIGCWVLGSPRDSFYFADLAGSGHDQLICANDLYWHAYEYGPNVGSTGWCLQTGYADPNLNNSTLGSYHLRVGDRFFFGNLDGLGGDDVLVINPVNPCPDCPFRTFKAMIQRWTPSGWQVVWDSNGSRYLGNWLLYQDLP